tara:strand:+ start:664 stop:1116 length:453 start_codon:yes stop_codon:yes gene_type:complete
MPHNLIPSLPVRKMWKAIRRRSLGAIKPVSKMDSDSVVREMRRNTGMDAPQKNLPARVSLEYYCDARGDWRARYTPMTLERAVQYRSARVRQAQDDFCELTSDAVSLAVLDLDADLEALDLPCIKAEPHYRPGPHDPFAKLLAVHERMVS